MHRNDCRSCKQSQVNDCSVSMSLYRPCCCRHFQELSGAGLDPDSAVAYSLKWTARTAEPVDVSTLRGLARQASTSGREVDETAAHVPEAVERQLTALFRSGDTLYLTLLLSFPRKAQERDDPPPEAQEAQPDGASAPLVDLDQLADLYTSSLGYTQAPTPLSAPIAESVRLLVRDKLPETLTWSPAMAQATILAALMLVPHFSEVRVTAHAMSLSTTLAALHGFKLNAAPRRWRSQLRKADGPVSVHEQTPLAQIKTTSH